MNVTPAVEAAGSFRTESMIVATAQPFTFRQVPAWVWGVVAITTTFWVMLGALSVENAQRHDFLNFYTGAAQVLHGHFAGIHDLHVELDLGGNIPSTGLFVRPSFYALILAPMALLPYKTAFWCWTALQCGLLACCWVWAFRRFGPDALVFSALFLPTALGIANGQDCVLLLVLLILAYSAAEEERPWASGIYLGLMLIKFHLVILWPVALVIQKRWKMLGGFIAAAVAEIVVSLAVGGLEGARSYIALLEGKDVGRLSPTPEFMISFEGLAANLDITSRVAQIGIVAAILVLFVVSIWKAPLPRLFAAVSTASLLAVPHVYGYDASFLLLGLWFTIFLGKTAPLRIVATLLTTPIAFGLTLADKPWAAAASLSLTVLLVLFAIERIPLFHDLGVRTTHTPHPAT